LIRNYLLITLTKTRIEKIFMNFLLLIVDLIVNNWIEFVSDWIVLNYSNVIFFMALEVIILNIIEML